MKKLEVNYLNNKDKYKKIEISFHDALIAKQLFHFIKLKFHSFFLYIIFINIYFVFNALVTLYKQTINTLWRDYLNNYFKYWTLIYLLPLFGLGVVLPSALVPVIYLKYFLLWASWIGIGCCFVIFVSPYSILLTIYLFKVNLQKKYKNQLSKVKIV